MPLMSSFDLAQQKLAECEKVTLHSCFTQINYDSLLYLHVGTGLRMLVSLSLRPSVGSIIGSA